MATPADDPFARFLCQVETWQRREARWKQVCFAAIMIALVTIVGAGIQFMVAWQSIERLAEATAESSQAQEELAALRKQWQKERNLRDLRDLHQAIGISGWRSSSRVNLELFEELMTGKDTVESPGKDTK